MKPSDLLSWPEDGLAVVDGGWDDQRNHRGHPIYRKPTITGLYSDTPQSVISDRSDQRICFVFTEDGEMVRYEGVISQDKLFRVLLDAGLLERRGEKLS